LLKPPGLQVGNAAKSDLDMKLASAQTGGSEHERE
jgi:hypothetical protein